METKVGGQLTHTIVIRLQCECRIHYSGHSYFPTFIASSASSTGSSCASYCYSLYTLWVCYSILHGCPLWLEVGQNEGEKNPSSFWTVPSTCIRTGHSSSGLWPQYWVGQRLGERLKPGIAGQPVYPRNMVSSNLMERPCLKKYGQKQAWKKPNANFWSPYIHVHRHECTHTQDACAGINAHTQDTCMRFWVYTHKTHV